MASASEEEREEMGAIVSEYQSFWNGHTDEMRRIDWENNHVYNEDADFRTFYTCNWEI